MMARLQKERRDFIHYSTLGVLGLVLAGGVVGAPYLKRAEERLRPPGAVDEDEFLALCIKCGQCLQACPYHSIKLADFKKGFGLGTPYIDARERGCYLCSALPCVLACPSLALDHSLDKPEDVRMGIAVLISPDTCIAIKKQPVPRKHIDRIHKHSYINDLEKEVLDKLEKFDGQECTICADMCPLPNPLSAIVMAPHKDGGKYPKVLKGCVGCGVCEELCPVDSAAIIVKPRVSFGEYYMNEEKI